MILADIVAAPERNAAPIAVLVIDDDPTQRVLVGAALESDAEIVEAENGLEGLHALENRRFDIAICDLEMPVMDGFGLIEGARARAETRHLPIIVVTGRDDVLAIERAFALGATSFLCKPINWNVFRHQVAYVLKVAEAERELLTAKLRAERLASLRKSGLLALEREIGRAVGALGRALEDSAAAEKDPQAVGNIAAVSSRLQSVLRRIERASEILDGSTELAPETMTAGELAQMAIDRLSAFRENDAAGRLTLDAPEALKVSCDPGLAAEALAEVLRNALTFSPPGSPVLLRAVDAPPDRVRFEVADRGPGIPDRVLDAASEGVLPEFRDRPLEIGLGLGLLMAKAIVDRHAGHFGILSEPGQGTEVFLSFPSPR